MLSTLVGKINGEDFSRKCVFKVLLRLSVAKVHRGAIEAEEEALDMGEEGGSPSCGFCFNNSCDPSLICSVHVTVYHLSPFPCCAVI